jgi:membrane-associated phospholipid phosphatase
LRTGAFWISWSTGALAWIGLLAFGSTIDLELSRLVAQPSSTFGQLVSLAGEWPAWLVICWSLWVLVMARRIPHLRPYRPLAWSLVLLALINPLVITQALKLLWGRVRFVHLAADASDFTPFYTPAGPGAGASFPSGHVAMAFVCAPIPFHLHGQGKQRKAALAWLPVLLYGVGVAWGRVRLGRHYLTDVLFTAGSALLLSPHLVRRLRTGRAG